MKIKFNQAIKDLSGKYIVQPGQKDPLNVKDIVSNTLIALKNQKNPIKTLDLALKIFAATEAIEVDKEDVKTIEDALRQGTSTVLVVGQVLKVLGVK